MNRTILIADDDPVALRMLEHQLTEAGYDVLTASDGREALQMMLRDNPPMLITDWHMPELSGLELVGRCRSREEFGWVYTIVLTSQSDDDLVVEAFEAGADDYLCKPVNQRELIARIRAGERIVDLERDIAKKTREIFRNNAELEVAYRKLAMANEKLQHMARTDELTDLGNRRAALTAMEQKWDEIEDTWIPMAVVILDLDHFKAINDTYGHDIGDLVLSETAALLRANTRSSEEVFRMGGEEFVLFCPQANASMAAVAAERMRAAVMENVFERDDVTLRITVSLGVAERTPEMECLDDLLKAADDALYAAKDAGRNCVRIAPTGPLPLPPTAEDEDTPEGRVSA
ncbi:MAG: diguanylate cyclase [Phycisphaerales bacterium]|nr:diguanylate cyclase [Phycisphaerae bacterium]NNF43324.1 diguanylate cyclase [Phycisphaerales bacterium]NNM25563.1 diguanylate cyclase [Phycisphaerales bacterium]